MDYDRILMAVLVAKWRHAYPTAWQLLGFSTEGDRSTWSKSDREYLEWVEREAHALADAIDYHEEQIPQGLSTVLLKFEYRPSHEGDGEVESEIVACKKLPMLDWAEGMEEAAAIYDEQSPRLESAFWEQKGIEEFAEKSPENEAKIAALQAVVDDAGGKLKALFELAS